MDSPPKLQRLMMPLPLMADTSYNEFVTSSNTETSCVPMQNSKNSFQLGLDEFERTMVDSAVSDIPGVFKEVYKAQKSHAGEMARRKQALQILQEKLNQVEEDKKYTEEEIACVMNRILLAKENITSKSKQVKEMDKALKNLSVEIVDKKMEVEKLEDDIQFEKRNQEIKQKKLDQFVQEVKVCESMSSVGQQIQAVKEKIAMLKQQGSIIDKDLEEKENVLTGKAKLTLTSELEHIQQQLSMAKQDREIIKEKIEDEKEKQSKINQTTQVLGKKNTAQMTRQKRQLKELQLRNRQRQTQVTQLETNIQQASKILDS